MSVIRRWDKSKPPQGPFALNRDCPQAQGLVAWYPMGLAAKGYVADFIGRYHLSGTTGTPTLSAAGAPALGFSAGGLGVVALPVSAFPLTMAAWCRPSALASGSILGLCSNTGASGYGRKLLFAHSDGGIKAYSQGDGAGEFKAVASGSYSAGSWMHAATVFASSSDSRTYRDGGNKGTSTTFREWGTSADRVRLGDDNSGGNLFSGDIGESGIWAATLDDGLIWRLYDPGTRFELWYPLRSRKWFTQGAGAQTVSITQVSETDTAQSLTAVAGAVTTAISQVSSTETAQALTVAATSTVTIGQVASTETAQSLTATTTVTTAITAAQETDTAQSINAAAGTTTAIIQVASTETAQAVTATNASTVAITQVQSTDTAQALTAAATKTQAITQAASTETAQAFTAVQPGVFTAVNESDAAQALSVVSTRTVAIGQVASTETAQALTPVLTTTTGITLALEIDAAQALASIVSQSVAVTQAQETDTARALTVFFEGGALDTVALYSIVTQLVSLSSKQTRTRSGDSYIAPVVSRDSHLGD